MPPPSPREVPDAPPPRRGGRREPSLFLALSGGGFRAALFEYGALKRLRERGLLDRVGAISATSGGALAAALYVFERSKPEDPDAAWERFEKKLLGAARGGILGPVRLGVAVWTCYLLAVGVAFAGLMLMRADLVLASWPLIGLGLLLHAGQAWTLVRMGARGWPQLWPMLQLPSATRRGILHLRLFEGRALWFLDHPELYLCAADLVGGREWAFSAKTAAPLDRQGCRELAAGEPPHVGVDCSEVPIADAVAASSAYPVLFPPVAIRTARRFVGLFVDGGLVDNAALGVPAALALNLHPDRPGFAPDDPYRKPTFAERYTYVLGIEAGAGPSRLGRVLSLRLLAIRRFLHVVMSRQWEDLKTQADLIERVGGVPTALVGLRVGAPEGSEYVDTEIAELAQRVRTHFDAFSATECALLALLGSQWIDEWLRFLPGLETALRDHPAATLETILPDGFGTPITEPRALARHLRLSHRRSRLRRGLGRTLADLVAR